MLIYLRMMLMLGGTPLSGEHQEKTSYHKKSEKSLLGEDKPLKIF